MKISYSISLTKEELTLIYTMLETHQKHVRETNCLRNRADHRAITFMIDKTNHLIHNYDENDIITIDSDYFSMILESYISYRLFMRILQPEHYIKRINEAFILCAKILNEVAII